MCWHAVIEKSNGPIVDLAKISGIVPVRVLRGCFD